MSFKIRIKMMTVKKSLITALLVISGVICYAQNLNNPNKPGPMGTEVNTFTGNLFIPRTDILIPARGFDFSIRFYYNSFNFDFAGPFGRGWGFEYDIQYKNDTLPGRKIFVWGDGREDKYDSLPNGSYKAPNGFFTTLSEYQPGKFVITEKDGTKYLFDDSGHRKLTRMENPNGNFVQLSYTDSLLTTLTNGYGQAISFTYDNSGRLKTIVDANASPTRTWSYNYDAAGNLAEVTDPLGGKGKYTYLVNGPMKTMSDRNNNKIDIIYFADLTIRELIGCNKRLSFSYDTFYKKTVVVDHIDGGTNQVTTYSYEVQDDIASLTSLAGNCCGFNVKYEYDRQGNTIKMTDANGHVYKYTYDDRGNMLTATDPLGGITTYTYTEDFNKIKSFRDPNGNIYTMDYDAKGNMIKMTSPGNNVFNATYNANGDIVSSTNPNGNVFNYNFDTYGNPLNVTGPNGFNATLSYDARGNLLAYTDGRENTHSIEYDILDRMKKITDPINNTLQFGYDAVGNITSLTNENNETGLIMYDASNRPVKFIRPMNSVAELEYDAMDNITARKNFLGHRTEVEYDSRNRPKTSRDAMGNQHSVTYDGNSNIISLSLANGQVLNYTYDQLNRPLTVKDALGSTLTAAYDANGNLIRHTNGTGAQITATYDHLNRVIKLADPLGNELNYTYDKNGNIITITDRNGISSHYTYDSLDRVKTYKDGNDFITSVNYDSNGNISQLIDQNGNITSYAYDELNRRKTMTFHDGSFQQYNYDNKGNLITKRLTDGSTITYAYDTLNRMVEKTLPGGAIFTYGHDALGRVISAKNDAGTVTIEYDEVGRIESESYDGRTVNYEYDLAGRSQTTIYPGGSTVIKEFDVRNRLIKVMQDSMVIAEYAYDNSNRLINRAFSNGVSSVFQYDIAGRLSNLMTSNGMIQQSSFTYDKEGNKLTINRQNNPVISETFAYDNGYRLINYKRGIIGGTPTTESTYGYDAVGNRMNSNINGATTTYGVNTLNQLTSASGAQNILYTYDDKGNLTYDGQFHKIYSPAGRLLKDSSSPALVITYQYDALGRRVAKTINGSVLKYTYSGDEQIEETDGANNLLNRTVFNNFLSPIMNEKMGSKFFIHANELGSVEAITNANGRLVESYRYDIYGKPSRFDSLNNPLAHSVAGNRFGFTGQVYDSATNSYAFYFRNYSPQTGVFNQRDLIEYGDGTGMYQYVGNNPANGIDIFGLDDCNKRKDISNEVSFSNNVVVKTLEGDWVKGDAPMDAELESRKTKYKNMKEESIRHRFGEGLVTDVSKKVANNISNRADDLLPEISRREAALAAKTDAYNAGNARNSKALGSAGKGLTALDLMVKGEAFASSLVDGQSNEQYTQETKAGGDLLLSGLTAATSKVSPIGLAYELTDLAMNLTTGDGITGHTASTGDFLGNTYSHFAYGTKWEMQWGRPARTDESIFTGNLYASLFYGVSTDNWQESYTPPKRRCPEGGTRRPPEYRYDPVTGEIVLVQPIDPNEIIGPAGYDTTKKWVSINDRMPYTILFENDKSATAPAKYIRVTTPIEPKQDALTFELGGFGFNNLSFEVPQGLTSYYQRLDCRDSMNLYVDVVAGYDQMRNQAFWEFRSIDPVTLLPTEEPLSGLLFLQDSTQPDYGHGFVNFTIKPKSNSVTGDTIAAKAAIVFDGNDTIPTNTYRNTIDAFAPESQLTSVSLTDSNFIALSWVGTDDAGGSGIQYYSLYVSTDGTNFSLIVPSTTRNDTVIKLPPLANYCFFVIATDNVGNTELLDTGEISCASIGGPLPVTWLYFRGRNEDRTNILDWATAQEQNAKEFQVERSLNGSTFTYIGTVQAGRNAGTNTYRFTDNNIDQLNSSVMFYRLKQIDVDNAFKYSSVVRLTYRSKETNKSIVYPNPTKSLITVIINDQSVIGTMAILYDINGKLLDQVKVSGSSQSFDLSRHLNGMYIIKLSNGEVLRVVKE